MKKLTIKFKGIQKPLDVYSNILLLLDFDGTISPIVKDPKDAVLLPKNKALLKKLKKLNVKVGIVTGRALKDIIKKVGLKGIIYAANHGMEIYANGHMLLDKGTHFRKPLKKVADTLEPALTKIKGTIVERKGLSIAIHFRKTPKRLHKIVGKIVKKLASPFLAKYRLKLTSGKMIWEIRPANFWNKGKAVLWIWKKLAPSAIPIYVGDDKTDEDAFAAIRKSGITIRIGRKKGSKAKYYANSFEEIFKILFIQ